MKKKKKKSKFIYKRFRFKVCLFFKLIHNKYDSTFHEINHKRSKQTNKTGKVKIKHHYGERTYTQLEI